MPDWVLWVSLGWLAVTLIGKYAFDVDLLLRGREPSPALEPSPARESTEGT